MKTAESILNRPGNRRNAFIAALSLTALAALGSAGCSKPAGEGKAGEAGGKPGAPTQQASEQKTPVTVTPAKEQTVTRAIPVTGSVTALQSVNLSAKVAARVLSVAGREGGTVRAGQIVVQQETLDFDQQLEQARANLKSAQVKVTQAETSYKLQLTQSQTGVQNAKAALAAAQANLVLAKNPQRTEEVAKAEIAVQQAQANYDRAIADRKRYEYLVKEGAAAQATLDQYVTTEAVQKANLDSAKQSLIISQTGGRSESIRASQEQVRQAEIALRLAQANVSQNQTKQDDIRAAKAAVAQNQATVDLALIQIAAAAIRAPIDGIISSRATEPGQQAAPGTTVLTIVALKTVYFQAQVPETSVQSLREGQLVDVRADAYAGQTFRGKVTRVFPTGSTSSRTFNVRVDIANDSNLLKPGMFARGEVVTERRQGIVIPKDALVAASADNPNAFKVFVAGANGTRAEQRPVKIGITTDTTAEVLSGVQAGDQIIVQGQDGLKDGVPINIVGGGSGSAAETPRQSAMAK